MPWTLIWWTDSLPSVERVSGGADGMRIMLERSCASFGGAQFILIQHRIDTMNVMSILNSAMNFFTLRDVRSYFEKRSSSIGKRLTEVK